MLRTTRSDSPVEAGSRPAGSSRAAGRAGGGFGIAESAASAPVRYGDAAATASPAAVIATPSRKSRRVMLLPGRPPARLRVVMLLLGHGSSYDGGERPGAPPAPGPSFLSHGLGGVNAGRRPS